MADASASFATPAEAEAYLTTALPAAIAANPKYRSKDTGVLTRWLVNAIAFGKAQNGDITVSMDESFDEYRGDAVTRGTHQAEFIIDDATIASEVSAYDMTESGDEARGVMFRCKGGPCVAAVWNGKPSTSAWTDLYVHDAATRQRILDAFRALQKPVAK